MTEDEAKTKWCPFVRMVNGEIVGTTSSHDNRQTAYNRVVDGPTFSFAKAAGCIGSACMAWRWSITPEHAASTTAIAQGPGGSGAKYVAHGHCGLAGAVS